MKLIIAEKPDIAKAVSKVLSGKAQWKNGYIEQGDYCVTWCYGHLLRLKEPEDYGYEYEKKNTPNEKLPIFFENWGMKIAESGTTLLKNGRKPPDKREQVETIGSLLKKTDLAIVAGDIDDEGQLLVEELLEWHHYTGPIKRLDTDVLNEVSLKRAMANLMDNDAWHSRAVSANARRVSDFILGVNGSRFFSNTYHTGLSVGRVQTVVLGLVANRDEQIESHTAQKYYLLDVEASLSQNGTHMVRFCPAENNPQLVEGKILNKSYLEKIGNGVKGRQFDAIVSKEPVSEAAPLPFSISALKSYCSEKFNIAPKDTLKITQSLRMNYGGLITYNRSECRYLPESMHAEAPAIISCIQSNLGANWNFNGLNSSLKSRAFDDANIGVHHAIIPTAQKADISKLTQDEQKVYRAICGYYMVQFMPVCEKLRTRLVVNGKNGNSFTATSTETVKKGFKLVMDTGADEVSELSKVPAGTHSCVLENPVVSEKETKPPKRYTDASLEKDMMSVAKYVTDPEIKRLLLLKDKDSKEDSGSIGTAATRSLIIETLKQRAFLRDEGKYVISTPLGREFLKILPEELIKPDLTAKWWAMQQSIQEGAATPEDMYRDVLQLYRDISIRNYPSINLSGFASAPKGPKVGTCPRCGKPIIETQKAFGCSGYKEGCKFTIWKEGKFGAHKILAASGKKISAAMVKNLLSKGKTLVHGLTSEKTGKKYDAYVTLQDTGSAVYVNLSFDDVPKPKKGGN